MPFCSSTRRPSYFYSPSSYYYSSSSCGGRGGGGGGRGGLFYYPSPYWRTYHSFPPNRMFHPSPCHIFFGTLFRFLSMFWLISMAAPFLSLVFPILLPSLAFAQLLKCISTTTNNGRPCRGGRPCHDSSTTEQREQHEEEKKEEPNLEDLRKAILLSFAEGAESSTSSSTTTTPPVGEEKDNDDENTEKPTRRVKTVYAVPQQLIRDETNNRTKLSIDVAGFSWNNDLKITFDEKLYLLTIQGERTNTLGDAIVLQRAVFLNKDLHEKDSIFAECNENVLTVTIAKKERTPVTVPIHQNEASRSTTGKEEAEAEAEAEEANEEVEVETVQNDDD